MKLCGNINTAVGVAGERKSKSHVKEEDGEEEVKDREEDEKDM